MISADRATNTASKVLTVLVLEEFQILMKKAVPSMMMRAMRERRESDEKGTERERMTEGIVLSTDCTSTGTVPPVRHLVRTGSLVPGTGTYCTYFTYTT
jgi:hypothetical protein